MPSGPAVTRARPLPKRQTKRGAICAGSGETSSPSSTSAGPKAEAKVEVKPGAPRLECTAHSKLHKECRVTCAGPAEPPAAPSSSAVAIAEAKVEVEADAARLWVGTPRPECRPLPKRQNECGEASTGSGEMPVSPSMSAEPKAESKEQPNAARLWVGPPRPDCRRDFPEALGGRVEGVEELESGAAAVARITAAHAAVEGEKREACEEGRGEGGEEEDGVDRPPSTERDIGECVSFLWRGRGGRRRLGLGVAMEKPLPH